MRIAVDINVETGLIMVAYAKAVWHVARVNASQNAGDEGGVEEVVRSPTVFHAARW